MWRRLATISGWRRRTCGSLRSLMSAILPRWRSARRRMPRRSRIGAACAPPGSKPSKGHRRTREGHLVLDRGGRQAPWPVAALYPAPVRGTGTTFTEYALEQRLQRAYRMLTDPRQDRHPIGSIALDAGFNDLSYLGATPRTFGPSPGTD
ncbi:MAG: helix-turn-helix domain-containing protein [Mesorhizobium sp.]|nr:helix-turn-helix domain-containing protein [Mesorhizobium sp. M1A.F.Ca.IN.022.04.1.1]RWG35561.1 MAG: helix-turn-helix domain-containing protein [Mesorhizobium sp.]